MLDPVFFLSFLKFMFLEFVEFIYPVPSKFTKNPRLVRGFQKSGYLEFSEAKKVTPHCYLLQNPLKEHEICRFHETSRHIMTENFSTRNFCQKILQKNRALGVTRGIRFEDMRYPKD